MALGKEKSDDLTAGEADRALELAWKLKRQEERKAAEEAKLPPKMVCPASTIIKCTETESPIEHQLLFSMNTNSACAGLGVPQYQVGPYRVDIAVPRVKLAIECDGRAFHSEPGQIERDARRTNYLASLGWTVIRFTGSRIFKNTQGCIRDIQKAFESLCEALNEKESWE